MRIDPALAEAAARLILAGYSKDRDINAKLADQGLPALNPRQIRHVVNSLNRGRPRYLDVRDDAFHTSQST
jgi:hypothetical protein